MKMKTIITGLTALVTASVMMSVFSFAASLGEVNGDSEINAKDAAEVLVHAASVGAGNGGILSEEAFTAADVNADGQVNSKDAAEILVYSAEKGAGGSPVFSGEKTSDEWKAAYQQKLSTLSSDYCYHLYDMDGDDIPELFTAAKNGSKQEGVSVYTYKNNALLSLGEYGRYGMLYVSGQYLVDYSDAKMSELQNYFYFDGTSVTLKDYICKSEYYAPYSVNGEEVSEEVYNSYRAKYPAFPDEYTEIGLDEYIGFGTAYDVSNLSPIENY